MLDKYSPPEYTELNVILEVAPDTGHVYASWPVTNGVLSPDFPVLWETSDIGIRVPSDPASYTSASVSARRSRRPG